MAVVGEILGDQLLGVVDDAHGGDGVEPQVGADHERLGIRIADAAEAAAAAEGAEVVFKFGAEGRVGNGMDLPFAARVPVPDGHTGIPGTQVAVVVRPEEHIQHHIAVRDRPEESAHQAKKSLDRVMGSIYSPSL